tara:strand:- start:1049 stop:2290 length:1242 start_codon:yes stop_codon:yes gene_type:complete
MSENTENVKKIRELEDFDTAVPISEKDYLIIATNEDADGDGNNERIPLTKKATIAQAVEVYNNSIARPPEVDSNTGQPAEPDPEEQPGYEETDPVTGETVKRITTPVNGGNLDNFLDPDGGLTTVDFCQDANNVEVPCNDASVAYKTKKLTIGEVATVQYIYSHITTLYTDSRGNLYKFPVPKHSIADTLPGSPGNTVENHVGTFLELSQYVVATQNIGDSIAPENNYHYFSMTKASNPYNPSAFDFHGSFYTNPPLLQSVQAGHIYISNWIGFTPKDMGGDDSVDYVGPMYLTSEMDSIKGDLRCWAYIDDINSWIYFANFSFPYFYIAPKPDFSNLNRVGWYKWEQKTGQTNGQDDPKKKYLTKNIWSFNDQKWYLIDSDFNTNPTEVSNIPNITENTPTTIPNLARVPSL